MGVVHSGPRNPNWRGGRVVDPRGYVLIRVGKDHPLADVRGYAYEHRLKAFEAGRLTPGDGRIVHHEDEVKGNNDPENLEAITRPEHAVKHRSSKNRDRLRMPGEPNRIVSCACGCGQTFNRFDGDGRPRRFVQGHNARSK